MEGNTARINISLNDGTIDITGSEGFVSSQIAIFQDVIIQRFAQISPTNEDKLQSDNRDENLINRNEPKNEVDKGKFDDVFSINGDKLSLLFDKAPGNTNKEKTQNLALIYLYGRSLIGVDEVNTKEISAICKHYACLDSTNFMKHIRGMKQYIIVSNSNSKTFLARLTAPGKTEALSRIEQVKRSKN